MLETFCKSCRTLKSPENFAGYKRAYKTCLACRTRVSKKNSDREKSVHAELESTDANTIVTVDVSQSNPAFSFVLGIDERVPPVTLEGLEKAFTDQATLRVSRSSEDSLRAYTINAKIKLGKEQTSLPPRELVALICKRIETCDGYRYNINGVDERALHSKIGFRARCSQSFALAKRPKADRPPPKRICKHRQRYDCGGRIRGVISLADSEVHVTLHHIEHERPQPKVNVPINIRHYIAQHAPHFDAKIIYQKLQSDFPEETLITQSHVYFWRREALKELA